MTPSWSDLAQLVEECDDFQDFKRKVKVEYLASSGMATRDVAEKMVETMEKVKGASQ